MPSFQQFLHQKFAYFLFSGTLFLYSFKTFYMIMLLHVCVCVFVCVCLFVCVCQFVCLSRIGFETMCPMAAKGAIVNLKQQSFLSHLERHSSGTKHMSYCQTSFARIKSFTDIEKYMLPYEFLLQRNRLTTIMTPSNSLPEGLLLLPSC